MADHKQILCWIRQAESDLAAAEVEHANIGENHRRYWYQQSYEKAIKAWGMMKYSGKDTGDEMKSLEGTFLKRHSPYLSLQEEERLPKKVYALQREIRIFVNGLEHANALKKIDATTPDFDATEISYRYPFLSDGDYVAPCDYSRSGWDLYQGNLDVVRRAVRGLIGAVKADVSLNRRAPS